MMRRFGVSVNPTFILTTFGANFRFEAEAFMPVSGRLEPRGAGLGPGKFRDMDPNRPDSTSFSPSGPVDTRPHFYPQFGFLGRNEGCSHGAG